MYINIFTQFLYNTCDLAYMFINRADIYNSHSFIYKIHDSLLHKQWQSNDNNKTIDA